MLGFRGLGQAFSLKFDSAILVKIFSILYLCFGTYCTNMDKSWIHLPRASQEFEDGVIQFLNFAYLFPSYEGKISCPCKKCNNVYRHNRDTVKQHMICNGLDFGYLDNVWIYHGELEFNSANTEDEQTDQIDNMRGMLQRAFGISDVDVNDTNQHQIPNDNANAFFKLLKDSEQELYPGCKKFTKLSFIVRLFHIKCLNGWSDKSITMLLEFLKEALPEGETLQSSFYQTKKIITDLGLSYNKIDVCPNGCMLFWKERSQDSTCSICGVSRWKSKSDEENQSSSTNSKVSVKVLRHFPLKPRLQRYFMSKRIASFMRWHENDRLENDKLRHPADSEAWKHFDMLYPDFASDPRNVRLGLTSDGFNPFGSKSSSYSTWPVVLMIYNLPPWTYMKQPNFIMSLLIPGPSALGNNIDVYLQPLIDELKQLWDEGVCTFDISTNENSNMRTALIWTISDFPAFGNMSG